MVFLKLNANIDFMNTTVIGKNVIYIYFTGTTKVDDDGNQLIHNPYILQIIIIKIKWYRKI